MSDPADDTRYWFEGFWWRLERCLNVLLSYGVDEPVSPGEAREAFLSAVRAGAPIEVISPPAFLRQVIEYRNRVDPTRLDRDQRRVFLAACGRLDLLCASLGVEPGAVPRELTFLRPPDPGNPHMAALRALATGRIPSGPVRPLRIYPRPAGDTVAD